ncbi:hypothetical protein Tco_0898102 [Tanacetum coccineum]
MLLYGALIPVAANEFRSVFGEASTSRSFCKTRVIYVESDDGGDDDWTQSSLLKEVGDEAVHKELGDRMKRAATTASSFEAEQDSGNVN